MRYFAYGSNMSSRRLRERMPGARAESRAILPCHRLAWHKIGKDGSGKCDIVADQDSTVWGVLYSVDPAEKHILDKVEDRGVGYDEREVHVILSPEDPPTAAFTYCARQIDPALQPYEWYKAHVLTGAQEHLLPEDYISMIQNVAAIHDRAEGPVR